MPAKLVETNAVFIRETRIVEVLIDDNMHHRQSQGAIGAGTNRKKNIGSPGRFASPGINNNEFSPSLYRISDILLLPSTRMRRICPH